MPISRRVHRSSALFFAGVFTMAASGCVVAVGNGGEDNWSWSGQRVSGSKLTELVAEHRDVSLGDSKEEVFQEDGLAPYSTAVSIEWIDGHQVESYRVRASTKNARFERWYYFVDDQLVSSTTNQRLTSPELVAQWTEMSLDSND